MDATAHLDAGAVDDGMTLTDIDHDKVYGFRANIVSGADLKSVKLELRGPGADAIVTRTENYRPYSLHGDSNGDEHGAALAAGSYTLTATAYSETKGGGSQLGTLSVDFTVVGGPLTVSFEGLPQTGHGGAGAPFTFRLVFSDAVTTTPEALRDHALEATNAAVEAVSRVDERSDLWEVRLTPETDAMVTVFLSPAADCDAAGAVCTEDGRMLSVGASRVILGPPPNSPATGQPTISGTLQVGETLTASTAGIADADGLDTATFSYQWLAGDVAIQDATGSGYTLTQAEQGQTVKVRVSFTDDAGHQETRTSDPTGAVEAAANNQGTGAPTITGKAQVGETLAADTSGIADADGLDTVTFSYQWMADDTNIQDATGSSYTLVSDDEGKAIKVIVSFTDDANNEESLPSAATDAVAALPGKPTNLAGEATAQEIKLTWTAPTGDAVVEYVVYRAALQNGSMNGQALSKYATIDAAGGAMAYTDGGVEEGVE